MEIDWLVLSHLRKYFAQSCAVRRAGLSAASIAGLVGALSCVLLAEHAPPAALARAPALKLPGHKLPAHKLPAHKLNAQIAHFRALDQRVFDLGWRIARANAPYCSNRRLAIGLKLIDAASYPQPAVAREALGIHGDLAIGAVAGGSSAARAGLTMGQEVARIASKPIARWPVAAPPDWRRLESIHAFVEAELARKGSVTIGFADGASATIRGEPICHARFELVANDDRALSDGARVLLGSRYRGFAFGDAILAAVIAHEIAHNILGHSAGHDTPRSREREADALAVWLIANAGFDPYDVVRMIERLRPVSGASHTKRATHDHWQRRARLARAEAAKVATLIDLGEPLDWRGWKTEWAEPGDAPRRR